METQEVKTHRQKERLDMIFCLPLIASSIVFIVKVSFSILLGVYAVDPTVNYLTW